MEPEVDKFLINAFDALSFDYWNKYAALAKLKLNFDDFKAFRCTFSDYLKDREACVKPLVGACSLGYSNVYVYVVMCSCNGYFGGPDDRD